MAFSLITTNVYANNINDSNNTTTNTTSNINNANEVINDIPKDENGNPLTGEDLKIYNIIKNAPVYTPTNFNPITT